MFQRKEKDEEPSIVRILHQSREGPVSRTRVIW